jgi:hypothetical protein
MGEKRRKVYNALIEGALEGLVDEKLRAYVLEKCPGTSSKRLVRASLLALSDPDIMNAEILHAIYNLAIKYRLDPHGIDNSD